MASSHGNSHSDTEKMERIITEFFAKTLHIILESRALYVSSHNSYGDQPLSSPSSSSSSSSSVRPRDKWFNLALRECPAPFENIDLLRQNNLESIIIDVVLVHRHSVSPKRVLLLKKRYPLCCNIDEEHLGIESKSEKIVERWILQYERRKIKDSNSGCRRSSNISLHKLYKKSILLLRSLYATVRLLPAYQIFRDLNSSAQIRPFTLAHRVSSFVEPFTRKEESKMMKFGFTPLDTSSGRLCVTVMYFPSASNFSFESLTSLSPQVISDYVGSPLADPLRRFPSLPLTGSPCHGSPSSRRHSWNAPITYSSSPPLKGLRCTFKIDQSTIAIRTGATADKWSSLVGRDEPQKYSGIRISTNSLPQISVSRNSSRSYIDDFDDTDFSCPFDVDYDDMKDPGSRAESLDRGHMSEALEAGGFFPIRKSQNAAVGALVHMLKKAPPLHQDLCTSKHLSETCNNNIQEHSHIIETSRSRSIMSSGIIATRKTTKDALEEFQGYKEMKKLLLMADTNKPQI